MPGLIEYLAIPPLNKWSGMPKPSPGPKPDPMAGVVDRLLAQLPGHHSEPPISAARPRASGQWTTPVSLARTESASQSQLIGVWARVFLGLAVGVMMGAGWPYPRACGMPLAGYLGAVVTVILTGAWAASAAWRYRASLAHIVSLIIVFYGIVLAAAELLPRTGYAVDHADWQCEETTQSVRISI
jgi:hypothetical protein